MSAAPIQRRNQGAARYVEAWSWGSITDDFVRYHVTERPLLNVCSGAGSFGDTTVDLYEPADVRASWTDLPFADDSYGAVFADPPWSSGHKVDVAAFMHEALRIAPVAYTLSPWVYGAGWGAADSRVGSRSGRRQRAYLARALRTRPDTNRDPVSRSRTHAGVRAALREHECETRR